MAASITVDKTADDDTNGSCTLWDAITAANTDTATNGCPVGSGADTITLAVNITLSTDLPLITSEITIEGANYDIDGNDEHHIFRIDGGDLTVNNITLTGGRAGSYGGGLYVIVGYLILRHRTIYHNSAGDDLESATLGLSCRSLFDSAVVRTTSRVVNCRVVDIGLIDKHPALASGMIAALDILGYVESGVEVCFRSVGDLVFLDPGTNPPTPRTFESYSNRLDMTCVVD